MRHRSLSTLMIEEPHLDRDLADFTSVNYREACLIRAIGFEEASRFRLYQARVVGNLSAVLMRVTEKGYVVRAHKGTYKLTQLGREYYTVLLQWMAICERRKLEGLCSTQSAASCSSSSSSTSV